MSVYKNYDDVIGQMQAFGLVFESRDLPLELGRVRRVKVQDDRERRGWYLLNEWRPDNGDALLVGSFGRWQGNESNTQKVQLKKVDMTDDQKAALKARMAEDRKRAEAQRQAEADRAARRAQHAWARCSVDGTSAYLTRKAVKGFGVKYSPAGNLVIPMCDTVGRVHGLQVIYAEKKHGRDKDFWPAGLVKKGHFFQIGRPDALVLIAEGYATAATLHEATGIPVVVAFDAGNLLPVAQAIHKKYRAAKVLVCADDDYLQKCRACGKPTIVEQPACIHCGAEHGQSNPGIEAASAAALAVGGAWVAPAFAGDRDGKKITDFNDLHAIEGLHVVCAQVEARLSALGWSAGNAKAAGSPQQGGGEKRRAAQSIMGLDELVARFLPIDDGTGEYVFDVWTNKVVKKSQMIALLPAGVRGDDIKRHPVWIERGAYFLDEVGFDPSGKDSLVKLNTWKGWPLKPKEGECQNLLDLLQYLCGRDDNGAAVYEWLLDWMAYPLQNPGAKMNSAVIMHGPQGTGKSTVFKVLAQIYGDYATVLNQRGLEDKFNSDWSDSKLFILAEEVVARAEMWHIKNELKELVTGEWIRINPKNIAAYRQRNQLNIVYLSNEHQPLPIENDDRRHLVVYTPPAIPDERFYDDVHIEIENGGVEAFYHFLMTRDLSRFHPKKRPPMTEAKQNLISLSSPSEVRFVTEWVTGDLWLPVVPCLAADLYAAYLKWCRANGEQRPRPSNQFHGAIMHMPGWEKKKARIYPSETAVQTEPKPMIFPPVQNMVAAGNAQPEGTAPAKWLTECVAKFAAALKDSEANRWAA